jgi:beta-galactosidase
MKVLEEGNLLVFEGGNFTYKLDTLSGLFVSLKAGSREMLDRPLDFNLWRAPTDNDIPAADKWRLERLDHTVTRAYSVTLTDLPDTDTGKNGTDRPVTVRISQSVAAVSVQPILRIASLITVFPDGRILLDLQAAKDPEIDTLPRIGLRLFLNKSMKQVSYYGMGPGETYIDKHHSGRHGCFRGTAASMHEDYIRPQENGSHYDCDYVCIKGKKLQLTAACADIDPNQTFSFNVSVYTQEELEHKRHNYELTPCGSTVLCIDHQLAGIGSKSCGPDLPPEYSVCSDQYRFAFILKPEEL